MGYAKKSLLMSLLACHFSLLPRPVDGPKEEWITIFIHGIMTVKGSVSMSNFVNFLTDNVQGTIYEKSIEILRSDPFFYNNQPMQQLGLHPIDINMLKKGNGCNVTAHLCDHVHEFIHPQAGINHYYSFGWSGLLSRTARYKEAQLLHTQLEKILKNIKNKRPKIRIIAYSHGGNVALYLAQVAKDKKLTPFYIDELICLGMPVQQETDHLINDPMFGSIFHLCSRGDWIQQLDFSSQKSFFSNRFFESREGLVLPKKLTQIELRVTKRAGNKKIHDQASCIETKSIILGTSKYLRDRSPGHIELWSYGWTPDNYRKNFPLYPLPMVTLYPYLIDQAKKQNDTFASDSPLIFDIRPEYGHMIIRPYGKKAPHKTVSFLPQKTMEIMATAALKARPENFSSYAVKQRIRLAYKKARSFIKQKNKRIIE